MTIVPKYYIFLHSNLIYFRRANRIVNKPRLKLKSTLDASVMLSYLNVPIPPLCFVPASLYALGPLCLLAFNI
jgi:hypothetical protein